MAKEDRDMGWLASQIETFVTGALDRVEGLVSYAVERLAPRVQRAQHIRFATPIMTPGRAGTPIGSAWVAQDAKSLATVRQDQAMTEILITDHWAVLRNPRGARVTPASNVLDFEPLTPADAQEKSAA